VTGGSDWQGTEGEVVADGRGYTDQAGLVSRITSNGEYNLQADRLTDRPSLETSPVVMDRAEARRRVGLGCSAFKGDGDLLTLLRFLWETTRNTPINACNAGNTL